MPRKGATVRVFAPERMREVDRFKIFSGTQHEFRARDWRTLSGVENHFHKAGTLLSLAQRLLHDLEADEKELEEKGFTEAQASRDVAAMVEGVIVELYSVVDCTARLLFVIYRAESKGFRDSTSRLFERVENISGSFPDRLKFTIGKADWFNELRSIRDELIHRDTGRCSKNQQTGLLDYWHSNLWDGEKQKPIEDVFGWLLKMRDRVNELIGEVFNELNKGITSGSANQLCGFVEGRGLMRSLDASMPLDFDNGVCLSHQWFTLPENPSCPFMDKCGAFTRAQEIV